ncbi:MAG: hypothetical protein M3546_07220 [Actinomycetota bacterium]|nr:hypothetical protein [Actinomycetota bacterium]
MHRVIAVAAAFAALLVLAGAALAAHNGNNRAELVGVGAEADASGVAIVNYSEGQGDFNGNVTVSGLMPNTVYSFYVVSPAGVTIAPFVCTGTSDAAGVFTCSAQHRVLPGFATAQIRLGTAATGTVVASGTFERRGNCRDPEQGGSQCVAPGQNK